MIRLRRITAFGRDVARELSQLEDNVQGGFDDLARAINWLRGKRVSFSFASGEQSLQFAHNLGRPMNTDLEYLVLKLDDESQGARVSASDSQFVTIERSTSSGTLAGTMWVW